MEGGGGLKWKKETFARIQFWKRENVRKQICKKGIFV